MANSRYMTATDYFDNFENMTSHYKKLISIFKNSLHYDNPSFKKKISLNKKIHKNFHKRKQNNKFMNQIKIHCSIFTILDSIERIELNSLSQRELEEIQDCFPDNNININEFRNCLAHAHYEISKDGTQVNFKKGDKVSIEMSEKELNNVAKRLHSLVNTKLDETQISDAGLQLNQLITQMQKGMLTRNNMQQNITPQVYAALLESYNMYHAFMFEKLSQIREQKSVGSYFDNRILLSTSLPYIDTTAQLAENIFSFQTLNFSELHTVSKADTLYFLLTSDVGNESLEELQKKFDEPISKDDIKKKIAVLYFYPTDYKDVAINMFKENPDEDNQTAEEKLLEYQQHSITDTDYKNIESIAEFMQKKFPRMGRIENGSIAPHKEDLLHGFFPKDTAYTFVYPGIHELIQVGTKAELIGNYINNDNFVQSQLKALEITENKMIKQPDFFEYLLPKYNNGQLPLTDTTIISIFEQLKQEQEAKPNEQFGKIYGSVMKNNKSARKDIEAFYSNISDSYKQGFIVDKMRPLLSLKKDAKVDDEKVYKAHESAYKYFLFLCKAYPDYVNLLNQDTDTLFKFQNILEQDLENRLSISEDEQEINRINSLLELGKLFKTQQQYLTEERDLPPNSSPDKFIDFTKLIEHIRDASIHRYTEYDCPKDTEGSLNFDEIKFNFQDYDASKKETTFLLMNLPAYAFGEFLELQSQAISDKILEISPSQKTQYEDFGFFQKRKSPPSDYGDHDDR